MIIQNSGEGIVSYKYREQFSLGYGGGGGGGGGQNFFLSC